MADGFEDIGLTIAAPAASETDPNSEPVLARFRILRRLGEGGMGVVYEAEDRERGSRVALKTLRRLDADMLLRLKGEFRALEDVEHPALVRLGELSCDGGTWFFTMELIDGVDFLSHVRPLESAPHFDETRLRTSLRKLGGGLRALHAAGKVHRDIKPSNVMVARDGRVVLLDFGVVGDAVVPEPSQRSVVGTIAYMAPEQAAGKHAGPAADLYSVGVVLYECLTGKKPFEGGSGRVMRRKQVEDPPRPRTVAADVPDDLDELCMDLMRRPPEERPTASEMIQRLEVATAHAHLGASDTEASAEAPSVRTPFVGRAHEIRMLLDAWTGLLAGRAATVLVEGESGVGKSTLVRRFAATLPRLSKRVVVLSGRCYEREAVPFKAVDGVVDALSRYLEPLPDDAVTQILPRGAWLLAQAFPVLRRVPAIARLPFRGQESRASLFLALRELLRRLAETCPLVVIIDDLHWADGDSLALLAEITRPPSPPTMLLVATARGGSGASFTGASPSSLKFGLPGAVTRLPLQRLARGDALALATMLLGDVELDRDVAEEIAKEADGHPLFLDELARHVRLLGGYSPAKVQLDSALAARVGRLEPSARLLLELLAVAGVALSQRTAMRAAGLDFAELSSIATTLRVAHLARTGGPRGEEWIEPYHDRVREAVVATLAAEARGERHTQLAFALEREPAPDAEALATHWLGAGDTSRAGEYALRAAHHASGALALERAANLYERALVHAPLDEETRQKVRIELGDALANVGRGTDAARVYIEAAARARAEQAIDLRRRAAEELLIAGNVEQGMAAIRTVLATVGVRIPRTPLGALFELLYLRMRLYFRGIAMKRRASALLPVGALLRFDACFGVARMMSLIDTILGACLQTRALLLAFEVGEPVRVSLALSLDAVWLAAATSHAEPRVRRALDAAESIARESDSARAQGFAVTARGGAAYFAGRFREALTLSDRAREMLHERAPGAFWELRTAATIAIWALAWLGEAGEAADRVEMGILEAEQRGDLYAGATLRLGRSNFTWLRTDDVDAARERITEGVQLWNPSGYHVPNYGALLALAELDLYEGNAAQALARVHHDWPLLRRALMLRVQFISVEASELRARCALGAALAARDATARRELVAAAEIDGRRVGRASPAYARALATLVDAQVRYLRGNQALAEQALTEAVAALSAADLGMHAAAARWSLGKLSGGASGRAHMAEANSWMARQGVVDSGRIASVIAPAFRDE